MAETWTVTPSEGVINNNDGTFEFPINETYCTIQYTIRYKDTDQGCECKDIYNQAGLPCLDDNHYGTGTDGTIHYVDECGETITVSASVPYTSYTHYVSDDCKSCLDGPTVYTSYTASDTVTFSENYGSAESDTGITESDTGGYIKYSYYQYGGCPQPAPCSECIKLSDNSGTHCQDGSPVHLDYNDTDGGDSLTVEGVTTSTAGATITGTWLDFDFGSAGTNETDEMRTIGHVSLGFDKTDGDNWKYCRGGGFDVVQCPNGECYDNANHRCKKC